MMYRRRVGEQEGAGQAAGALKEGVIKPAADAVTQQAGAVAQQVREQAIHPAKGVAQDVPRQAAQALEQQVLQPGAQAVASQARPTAEKVASQVVDPAVGLVQVGFSGTRFPI